MKKLISLVFAVLFLGGNAFAAILPLDAEVAVKAGLDWGRIKVEQEKIDRNDLKNASVGISVGGEVLYPFTLQNRRFKGGIGLQYLLPKHVSNFANSPEFSWLPVYATLLGYPLLGQDMYLKLNLGYTMSYVSDFSLEAHESRTDWTGKYLGLGVGFDLSRDLFVEVIYDRFFTETSYMRIYPRNEIIVKDYIRVSVNAGYRFKI
jgi:hypothetical protein